jgi:hypothetical protein
MSATRANGVIHGGQGPAFTTSQGLSSDVVNKSVRDQEGTIWVATGNGLDQMRKNVLSRTPLPPGPEFQIALAADSTGL